MSNRQSLYTSILTTNDVDVARHWLWSCGVIVIEVPLYSRASSIKGFLKVLLSWIETYTSLGSMVVFGTQHGLIDWSARQLPLLEMLVP